MADIWEIIRPGEKPTGSEDHDLVGDGKGGPKDLLRPSEIRPIEAAVIDIAASLAGLVVPVTDIAVLKRPDDVKSRYDWLKELYWNAVVDDIYSIVAIRYAGRDSHYLVKPDGLKPDRPTNPTKYTYTRNFTTFSATPRNVLQFRGHYQSNKSLETMRKAEDSFWHRYKKIGYATGFLGQESLIGHGVDTEDKVDAKLLDTIMRQFVSRLPRGRSFHDMTPKDDIEKNFETLVRFWCYNYKVPTSLVNLDLPSHSVPNISASYGHFIRQALKPVLEPVFEILAHRNGGTVKLDYSAVERGTIMDVADGIMKLSQTGVLTINEIRAQSGYGPIDGGDRFPDAAGAPPSSGGEADAGQSAGN